MSYISSLNLLNADSPVLNKEEGFSDDLSLWANAQFTFDVAPGTALHDEDKEKLFGTTQAQPSQEPSHTPYLANDYLLTSTAMLGLPRLAPAPADPLSVPNPALVMPLPAAAAANNDDDDTQSLVSPEDDKRRRNTAASARFRLKKKMREQALEQKAKDMSTKCEQLEHRVRELEMEAKWLRALVVEKDPALLPNKQ
ncbi:hypothetical protein BC940DRAFT_257386 [Gongronella butleri]|nr:hypothetical protein BC940DRAFT_257386 [Gongronella butleri]